MTWELGPCLSNVRRFMALSATYILPFWQLEGLCRFQTLLAC